MANIKKRNRQNLIDTLQEAARLKGSTPTSLEADRRKYGMRPKRTYILEFGSWNKAIEAAGLQARPWKGRRRTAKTAHSSNGASVVMPRSFGDFGDMRQYLNAKIEEEQAELDVLIKARDILERRAS